MIRAAEVAIVGAGMAGASLAAEIAAHRSVLLLEAEAQPGYHSTGRSAAFWSETYGGPLIQPLTTASEGFLRDRGLLKPRGAIHIAGEAGEQALAMMAAEFADRPIALEEMDRAALERRIPGLRKEWRAGIYEPSCADIDVAGLHAAYLAAARAAGVALVTSARLRGAQLKRGRWHLETAAGEFVADVLVNAAGAWADEVAVMASEAPLGIQPYRRTIVQLRVDPPAPPALPLIVDALSRFYFKPEAGGRLWLSPHDETPCPACDCAPEEIDIALAIDRLQRVVDWRVERIERRWAGLRSFAADRLPVYGYAPGGRGFFWCAGQGGFGIQTAPAAAKLAASLLLGSAPEPMIAGLDPGPYLAGRFAR
jgi:D-arginine dehydrogenase